MATIYWSKGMDHIDRWIGGHLPFLYANWLEAGSPLRAEFDNLSTADRSRIHYSPENFTAFSEKFNRIAIDAGQPHGDYGQTIELSSTTVSGFSQPNFIWRYNRPKRSAHFPQGFSEELHFKHEEQEVFGTEMIRHVDTIEMTSNKPLDWFTLGGSAIVGGRVSNITHRLDTFVIEWVGDKIRVKIEALAIGSHKPPLGMYV